MSDPLTIFQTLAEQKIAQAMEEGLFDDLPGQGQPLKLDDDSHIPQEMRMAYRILKNSGHVSPEVEDRKEISNIIDMLEDCEDEQLCYKQIQKLNLLVTKINEKHKRPVFLEDEQLYYAKVVQRIRVRKQLKK